MISTDRKMSLAYRGLRNYLTKRPLSVSFEITYSCNAHCKHCHLGGIIKDEDQASPEKFGELAEIIQPVVAQVSGGEPLLRKDVADVVKAIRRPNKAPYIVLTTNARLLTKEKYYELLEAGVDQFSISLDYPDERHDQFRKIRGLYKWIENLIHELHNENEKKITFSCVVQKDNFRELINIAKLVQDWGAHVNFSTYTWLRTMNKDYMLTKNDLPEFRQIVKELLEMNESNNNSFANEYTFNRMIEFFEKGTIANCRAGERFFIVNPNGKLSPCGLILKYYDNVKEMKNRFVKTNTCVDCNTCIRASCEKPLMYHIREYFGSHKGFAY